MPARFRQGHRVNGQRWVLQVAERPEGKALIFEGTEALVQGLIDPARPLDAPLGYLRAAAAATCAVEAPARMLVLGLGAGVLPRVLEALYPAAELHAVELDPAVVEVAREHFGLQPGPRLQVHVADAADWVPSDPRAYDVLFLDCYGPDDMPEAVSRAAFFDAALDHLTPGGVLVANILA
ncbi:MAG: fused MFS/spermidine synthase, partial [Myxococcales bacterium]|nr:fused MFS/spermidine synthase [Myxococcales bacterium]